MASGTATSGWDILASVSTATGALLTAVAVGVALLLGVTARNDEKQRAADARGAELDRERRHEERVAAQREADELQEARRIIVRATLGTSPLTLPFVRITAYNMSRSAIVDVYIFIAKRSGANCYFQPHGTLPDRLADAIPPMSSAPVDVHYDPALPQNSSLEETVTQWLVPTIAWTDYHNKWKRDHYSAPEKIGPAGP